MVEHSPQILASEEKATTATHQLEQTPPGNFASVQRIIIKFWLGPLTF